MANPQLENGFTRIANEIFDALAYIRIPGEAHQVLTVILRKTYGFQKSEDAISLSQFCLYTKLRKGDVCRAINKLISMGIISKKANGVASLYRFNKDFSTWRPLAKKQIVSNKANASLAIKRHTKETTTKEINTTVESAVASPTVSLKLNNEIHPMKELEEPAYVSEEKPRAKSKHGTKTMAVLAYAYAKASGADLSKSINGSAWLKPLSEIYEYFEKDADAAVDYINRAVAHYDAIKLKDGSKCNYSIRTIQNVQDVERMMSKSTKDLDDKFNTPMWS